MPAAQAADLDATMGVTHPAEEHLLLDKPADLYDAFRTRTHQALNEQGIHFGAGYAMTVLGNPAGGAHQGATYSGLFGAGLDFDFGHWFDWTDAVLRVSGSWAGGDSLSEEYIHNAIDVSNVFSGRAVRLYELSLRDTFFDDALELRFGRLSVGARFGISPLSDAFVNLSFNENLAALSYNDPAFVTDPVSVWGMTASWEPKHSNWRARLGIFDASDPDQWNQDTSGIDFSFDPGAGVLLVGEVETRTPEGLPLLPRPAHLALGFFVDTGKRPVLGTEDEEKQGNYNLWLTMEQSVATFRDEADDLSAFLTFVGAPQASLNTFLFSTTGGLVWRGWHPARPQDAWALGVAYYQFSKDLPGQSYEMAIDFAYTWVVNSWLRVQPDIQGVIRPDGRSGVPNALVVGFAADVTF